MKSIEKKFLSFKIIPFIVFYAILPAAFKNWFRLNITMALLIFIFFAVLLMCYVGFRDVLLFRHTDSA